MKLFIKPFEQEVFGKQTLVTFPYPREDMYSDSIFPYLVFDGGAFFFLNDRLNAQDSDRLMTLLEQGKLFEPWSQNGEFDWDSVYKHPLFASAPIFEQHVWIQRLYFLLPLAHRYGKTGDKKFAALWLSYLKDWWNAHPYQPYEDISYLQTDLVWRDMQVAWRTLMLCYSIYFLGEHNPFALADWQFIYDVLITHADHLCREAEKHLATGHAQNHVLQVGLALLYCGVLFPHAKQAALYHVQGKNTIEMNRVKTIFPDGGNDESCPSYSHFIARMYLEAYLLKKENDYDDDLPLKKAIQSQYAFAWQMSSPGGTSLQLNDSYAMDAHADLWRVAKLFPLNLPDEKSSCFFPHSKMAVLRQGNYTVYIDGADHTASHMHMGRPQVIAFYGNTPVLVDSGSPSYDANKLRTYLKGPEAHNGLYVREFPIKALRKYKEDCTFTDVCLDGDQKRVVIESNAVFGKKSYLWTRTVVLTEQGMEITDHANAEESLCWVSRFHLSDRALHIAEDNKQWKQYCGNKTLFATSSLSRELGFAPAVAADNRMGFAHVLTATGEGTTFDSHFRLEVK